MFRINKKSLIFVIILVYSTMQTFGQCAMCRAVLESEDGQSSAEGVNNGIMYLMSIPYILVAGIGCIIYYKFFRNKSAI